MRSIVLILNHKFLFHTKSMKKTLLLGLVISLFYCFANAAEPAIWTVNTRADVLKGDARGVSIDENGAISLAPRLTEIYKTAQPYIWSSVIDTAGNIYLGTGGDGRIFKVAAGGNGSLLADLNELNVSALAIGRGGELFAATSPDGKVYRVDQSGKADVYFDAKEKYIWALAVMPDGSLAVGTGESGKIYRVRSAGAAPDASLLFDTSEAHIISLAVDKQGNLIAGTDSNGLVIRFGPDGKPFALLDSPLREIHEITVGPDGSLYVLALGDSVSSATPSSTPAPSSTPSPKTVSPPKNNVPTPEPPQKSRYDLSGAKSAVYRILPNGSNEVLWASSTVSGFSIYAHQSGSGVLLGTSDKGRIYNINNEGRETLVLQSDTNQISTIRSSGRNLYATSSNQGALFRIGGETVTEGTYESEVLDAKTTATWGRIWWRSNGGVQIQTRSGNTAKADETWSPWANVSGSGQSGQIASPVAQYLQWRAVLKSSPAAAELREVNVAFLGRNIAPEILSITILPTNVGLIANPPVQIDPNIELSGLDPSAFGLPSVNVPPRRVYQRAARSFQWTAEDRNDDKLVYDVLFKEAADTNYKLLSENISESFYTIDGLSLADGRYTIKIIANDSPANPDPQALSGERISESFDIDNGQPIVSLVGAPQIIGDRARVSFTAVDRGSYLNRAEYSVNGSEWQTVFADDGITDGPEERYTFEIPMRTPGEYTVTLRVFDASGNAGNARAMIRK